MGNMFLGVRVGMDGMFYIHHSKHTDDTDGWGVWGCFGRDKCAQPRGGPMVRA